MLFIRILTPCSLTVAISDSFKPPVNIALKYGLAADSITFDLNIKTIRRFQF